MINEMFKWIFCRCQLLWDYRVPILHLIAPIMMGSSSASGEQRNVVYLTMFIV